MSADFLALLSSTRPNIYSLPLHQFNPHHFFSKVTFYHFSNVVTHTGHGFPTDPSEEVSEGVDSAQEAQRIPSVSRESSV